MDRPPGDDKPRFPPHQQPTRPPGHQRPKPPPMMGSIPRRSLPPPQHPPPPHMAGYPPIPPPPPGAGYTSFPQGGPPRPPGGPPRASLPPQGPPRASIPPQQGPPRASIPPQQGPPRASLPPQQGPPRFAHSMPPPGRSLPPPQQAKRPHTATLGHVPRKKNTRPALPTSSRPSRPPQSHVTLKSEDPFVICIKSKFIDWTVTSGIPRMRSSGRAPKRKRPSYEELRDTDSDDFASSDDDEEDVEYGVKRSRLQKARKPRASPPLPEAATMLTTIPVDTDTPPPGTLSTLWYSREVFLHKFVLEKILGWKTRPVVKLEWHSVNDIKMLDPAEAELIRTKLLLNEDFWNCRHKRMEVSRTNAATCPLVMAAAAEKEACKPEPRYTLKRNEDEREEVLLVKWRGRSHMHCSWERRKDLEKFDPSNNTAKNKIRRYFQAQEVAMGKDWKKMLERETTAESGDAEEVVQEEEYFPPQYVEVERILACDENEMDRQVLARQRALNLRTEQEALRLREEEETPETMHHTHRTKLFENLPKITDGDAPWDPEDNVRYVVKWKGLQYAEMTWEYWRDIKRDAVDEAEDFWYRQRVPSPTEVFQITSRPHPLVRDFRKLTVSPEFARSHRVRPVAKLEDDVKEMKESDEDNDAEASKAFRLRSYQLEGVNWLLFNWFNKRSCILADEMGLGKTIQSVGFLQQLHELPATQVRGPFLIVAPLSLIGQWQSESQTWAPDLNVVVYHGSADARDFLVQQEFYYTEQFVPKTTAMKLKKQHITKFHILITTYEVVLKDIAVLSRIRWKALIVDEAHRLKNPKARLFEELATVPRDFCLLLTGTPLQNSTEELWALLHFSDPVAFASKDDFIEKFGQLTDSKQVSDLHSMLKPYLLRRVKEDVEKSLPPKEETILEVSLTPTQKTYYKAIYERNTSFLFKGAKPSNAPSLMNIMMELRKCCNHPFLIRGVEERILNEAAAALKGKKDENGNEVPVDHLNLFGSQLVKSSGKMVLLEKLLPKLFAGGHKVLIFSQMVRCLDLLQELLIAKKYRYERLDGSTTASARAAAVDRFHRKSCQRFVMLLSTRAGGLGLNLTAADVVIIFDSDWNPQNDLQAMARAHRIGQTRSVSVYRLLTAKTYEMHMFHAASLKLGLDRAVLAHQRQQENEDGQEGKSKTRSEREVQAKEIDELLKKGAYDVFRDDDDAEAKKFMDTDIDQLLESSAKKVTYGNANASSMSSGLGSFSKASFVADTGDGGAADVDLDDPDFWNKAVGLDVPVETPEEISAMIDDGVKRSRKQVQVFDPYAAFAEAEQKKKDKVEKKIREEKEEKVRKREKKKRSAEEKERRKREKEEARGRLFGKSSVKDSQNEDEDEDDHKATKKKKEGKQKKKSNKNERRRALQRAENEDPLMERLKQAWEVPQRNRATSATLRFGFGRFCKLRNESNLTSLPIQDMEVFLRQYIYQLSLQVAVTLLKMLGSRSEGWDGLQIRHLLRKWFGSTSTQEIEWVCDSVYSAVQMQIEVENRRRFLRIPSILAEPAYVAELRQGAALRALRRVSILNRLNTAIENVLDDIFTDLGHEELGKRGCPTKDLTALDADLKARYVTTEELTLALSATLPGNHDDSREPCTWWDRSCDIGLLIGTFIHGFGNYESMRNDLELPFAEKIQLYAEANKACTSAYVAFRAAMKNARTVFDDALDSAKSKAKEEAHAVVAAAVAASKVVDEESSATSGPDAVQELKMSDVAQSNDSDGDDTHFVTLARLADSMASAARTEAAKSSVSGGGAALVRGIKEGTTTGEQESDDDSSHKDENKLPLHQCLPMADARILDNRLLLLVTRIEGEANPETTNDSSMVQWETESDVSVHENARKNALSKALGMTNDEVLEERREFQGIGFSGAQCASSYRSLDSGSDYSIGAASTELAYVASGNDAPRYLRALGVPMNITRYAALACLYTDSATVQAMLSEEKRRNSLVQENNADEEKRATTTEETSPKATSPPHEVRSVMPAAFRDAVSLRASVCAAALHYGFAHVQGSSVNVDTVLWAELERHLPSRNDNPAELFSLEKFGAAAASFVDGATASSADSLSEYVQSFLLPHCFRLCVMGNGPTTRNTRGSRGQYETALGYSQYQEFTNRCQCPLPDPCAPMAEQSIEAVACASAILRRTRLMRAVQYICRGGVSFDRVKQVLQSSIVQESVDDLPVWWCPEIHDLGLLVRAATRGLFSVFVDRDGSVFAPEVIRQHTRERFESSRHLGSSSLQEGWIEEQSQQFPSANALERRLGLLCSEATAHLTDNIRYDNLPMFDHGGWPRN